MSILHKFCQKFDRIFWYNFLYNKQLTPKCDLHRLCLITKHSPYYACSWSWLLNLSICTRTKLDRVTNISEFYLTENADQKIQNSFVFQILIQLAQCQDRMHELEKELENPYDEKRVRFLEGKDPNPSQLNNRIEDVSDKS